MRLLSSCRLSLSVWLLILAVALPQCGPVYCKELTNASAIRPGSGDWLLADRQSFDVKSRTSTSTEELKQWLKAAHNSFAEAALVNIKTVNAGDYEDIRQRHSFYDFMSFYFEGDDRTKPDQREIRFFHATSTVTVQGELGIIASVGANLLPQAIPVLAKRFGVSRDALTTIDDINADLFKANMRILRLLVYEWPSPRDPRVPSPTQKIDALAFDLDMVDFEQGRVQDFVAAHAVPDSTLADISKLVRMSAFDPVGTVRLVRPWLRAAGFKVDSFADYSWRVAMGRALVFLFHKKGRADYVAYMKANPPERRRRQALYDAIQAPSAAEPGVLGDFTIVGSWRTQKGAARQVAELRRKALGIVPAMFPPYGRDRHWTVALAAFATPATANEIKRHARRLAADAFVAQRAAVDPEGKRFTAVSTQVDFLNTPNLLKTATSTNMPDAIGKFVTVFRNRDEAAVRSRLAELRMAHPGLPIAEFQYEDGTKALTLASFADERGVGQALELARHLGVPNSDVEIQAVTEVDKIARLDSPVQSQSSWGIVGACYRSGHIDVGAMKACSGLLLTPSMLTQCVVESGCLGLQSAGSLTGAEVASFLRSNSIELSTKLTTDVAALPLTQDAGALARDIQACRNASQGGSPEENQKRFVACLSAKYAPRAASGSLNCALSTNGRVADLLKCVANASGDPKLARIAGCVDGDKPDLRTTTCLAGSDRIGQLMKVERCFHGPMTAGALLNRCAPELLDRQQRAKLNCVVHAASNPRAAVACALSETGNGAAVVKAIDCAERGSRSVQGAGNCLSGIVGGEGGRAAGCVAQNTTKAGVIDCMLQGRPELGAARKVFECAAGGADAASLVANCSEGLFNDDARHVAGCIARNGGDRGAMAGCAAGALLPKELGPVAQCASSSTGGTEFALCMAAPTMNAEWRIAAECAVSSGGEPISFASCTGGRLTVRELTKCLTGKIGEACFGKGNTIVAAFTTVGHDLANCLGGKACLGPGNDLVMAADKVGQVLEAVGQAAGKAWNSAFGGESDWCRGDLTKWTCHL